MSIFIFDNLYYKIIPSKEEILTSPPVYHRQMLQPPAIGGFGQNVEHVIKKHQMQLKTEQIWRC
jgi:hypothetical protein